MLDGGYSGALRIHYRLWDDGLCLPLFEWARPASSACLWPVLCILWNNMYWLVLYCVTCGFWQTISDVKLQERERLCNTGRGKGTKGTALEELEEAFIAKSNQYNGVLPPILSYNIQRIGITALTLATDSYEANTRDAINTAIWRWVAVRHILWHSRNTKQSENLLKPCLLVPQCHCCNLWWISYYRQWSHQ